MVDNCLFCKIVAGVIPADKVYEDELVVAFKDIDPQAPVHLLIIPRKHIARITDITDEDNLLIAHIHQVAVMLAKDFDIAEPGFRLVNNCNEDGGQAVYHLHYHLLGGRKMAWPPG
ncbi:MAG: histidine triad nucleotide-binding protein [Desulfobacteraceae bacterium 4572_35.1]|nr:MAG: histidine triad nucleotide-binding protein [Desulfobacteraceae bacterium 4572_35.1]